MKLWREFLVGFAVPVGISCAVVAAFVLVLGCGDGPDLVDVTKREAPAIVAPGCDPPDAGSPDADFIPINPGSGAGGFGE